MEPLEKAIKQQYKEYLFLSSRIQGDETIEFETRLGVSKSNNRDELFWTLAYAFATANATKRLRSQYRNDIIEVNNVQFRQKEQFVPGTDRADLVTEKSTWQLKKKLSKIAVYENWAVVQLSSESVSHPPSVAGKTTYRYISRHSFIIGSTRLDFTRALNTKTNMLSHEVEAEFVPGVKTPGITAIDDYILTVKATLLAGLATPLPFSKVMFDEMCVDINTQLGAAYTKEHEYAVPYIDKDYFAQAIPLTINMLTHDAMFKNVDRTGKATENKRWAISLKTDGERRFFIVCSKGAYMVNSPYQAALYALSLKHTGISTTVLDGELTTDGKFYIIDGLIIDGVDVRKFPYSERTTNAEEWSIAVTPDLIGPVLLTMKAIAYTNNSDENGFFKIAGEMWASRVTCGFPVDGLIFTPDWEHYYNETGRRTIFKWKPNQTIDLRVRRKVDGKLSVYAIDGKSVEVEFTGSTESPMTVEPSMQDIVYVKDAIIEFSVVDGALFAFKERLDKQGPNGLDVARGNWNIAMIEDQTISSRTLLCENSILMRKYHNKIKAKLFNEGAGVLLDIGSGRGGDIRKWRDSGYTKVFAIEPDGKNILELESRLSAPEYKDFAPRVHILQARGQDTKDIMSFIKKHSPKGASRLERKVDTISMMDSLTFFFGDDDSLKELAYTIKSTLKEGGVFIWKALDGSALESILNERGITKLSMNNTPTNDNDSDFVELIGENQVKVKIGKNVANEESLVDIDRMKKKFGMSAGVVDRADEESLLTENYATLSSLYKHGVFIKGERLTAPQSLVMLTGSIDLVTKSMTKPITPQADSAIVAFEGVFTSRNHNILLSSYWARCLHADPSYTCSKTEPAYTLFETANDAYFLKAYLEGKNDDSSLTEQQVLFRSGTDDEASLAFAGLLEIDMIIVDSKGELLATNVVEDSDRLTVIVVKTQNKSGTHYVVKLIAGEPLTLASSKAVSKYEKIEVPGIHQIYIDSISDPSNYINQDITIQPTSVQHRMAFIDNLDDELRLWSLANMLVSQQKTHCTHDDIENIGVESTESLIRTVNRLMKSMTRL